MLNIFNAPKVRLNTFPITTTPNLNRKLFSQLLLYKKFMFEETFYVNNNNPFVMLLNDAIPYNYKELVTDELIMTVKNRLEYIATVMGMTSNRNRGKYFKEGNLRYMVLLEENIDIKEDDEYDVIRVLYTDYDTVDYSYNIISEEFMILELNPAELVLSYIRWAKIREEKLLPFSYHIYVATVLQPKIWDTKINYVIFNRFMKIFKKLPVTPYKNKHSIQLMNLDQELDSDIKRMIKLCKTNNKLDIRVFLNSFKFLNNKMINVLNFNTRILVSNTVPIFFLSRISYVSFLLDFIKEIKAEAINVGYMSDLTIWLRRYNNGLFSFGKIPTKVDIAFKEQIKKIKEDINYR